MCGKLVAVGGRVGVSEWLTTTLWFRDHHMNQFGALVLRKWEG